jgi:hypothetical protein
MVTPTPQLLRRHAVLLRVGSSATLKRLRDRPIRRADGSVSLS